MIAERKKVTPFDYQQLISGNCPVMALRFDDKSVVKDIIEKFKKEILGLNLYVDDGYFVQKQKSDIVVHELPPSTNFESIQSISEFAAYKYLPNPSRELGTISANDDTIILNINHSVCDGKYIAGIAQHIFDDTQKLDSFFPVTFDEEFSEEIKQRLNDPPTFFQNDPNNTIFNNFGMKKINREILYDCIFDTKTMSNYDVKTKKCHDLTAAIVTAYSLALSAIQGEENVYHLGGSMSANMRNVLREKKINGIKNILDKNHSKSLSLFKNPITINHANFFTVVPITTKVTPSTKIKDCYMQLNKCLKNHFILNKNNLFDFRSTTDKKNPRNVGDDVMICFSNLGPINIKKPLTDLYLIDMAFNGGYPFCIALLTYAVIDKRSDRNDFHAQMRYGCNGLNEKQSFVLAESLKHYLQCCNTNRTIHEVYEDIKSFQKSFQ